ncbi:MAG TPA: hypothetical protein VJM31_00925 [Vicinamibacterales bacterium]|nr:hypothetical protein [Vicinamibacterales bacterium]
MHPRAYGLTNLWLLVCCAGLVAWLASVGGLAPAFSLFAAALFAFNVHGVDMAVLWISGRTALLLTLFSVGAAVAFLKQRVEVAALLVLCAMFSKEEGVVLPMVFLLWGLLARLPFRRTWAILLTLPVYLGLRTYAGAMWPATAPSYYRFSSDPQLLLRNVAEYADRACTISAVMLLAIVMCARAQPHLTREHRTFLLQSVFWLVGGFALTIFLPVRSSLYALFPSVGAALAASTLAAAWWPQLSAMQKRALPVLALILPLALFPVYRARGDRWVSTARLSSAVLSQLVEQVNMRPEVRTIVLLDDQSTRVNLSNAFGSTGADVAFLFFQRPVTLHIETDPAAEPRGDMVLALDGKTGRLIVMPARQPHLKSPRRSAI